MRVFCQPHHVLMYGGVNVSSRRHNAFMQLMLCLSGTVSRYSLFVNEETKSWTLIQFDEKIACVLGVGEASTRIFNGPTI
jgi:hypothetical protein